MLITFFLGGCDSRTAESSRQSSNATTGGSVIQIPESAVRLLENRSPFAATGYVLRVDQFHLGRSEPSIARTYRFPELPNSPAPLVIFMRIDDDGSNDAQVMDAQVSVQISNGEDSFGSSLAMRNLLETSSAHISGQLYYDDSWVQPAGFEIKEDMTLTVKLNSIPQNKDAKVDVLVTAGGYK